MIVMKPIADQQTIKIIPREYVSFVSMLLRDDSTNLIVNTTPNVQNIGNYMELSNTFNFLKEGRFYDLKIVDVQTQEIIYMGKVFCTAQEIDQTLDKEYSINKGVYITENTRNNDYVVL